MILPLSPESLSLADTDNTNVSADTNSDNSTSKREESHNYTEIMTCILYPVRYYVLMRFKKRFITVTQAWLLINRHLLMLYIALQAYVKAASGLPGLKNLFGWYMTFIFLVNS